MEKTYAVILQNGAADELGEIASLYCRSSEYGDYIYAKKIDPNGSYFHMWLNHSVSGDELVEVELQIPHNYIKAIFYAADVTKIGFN